MWPETAPPISPDPPLMSLKAPLALLAASAKPEVKTAVLVSKFTESCHTGASMSFPFNVLMAVFLRPWALILALFKTCGPTNVSRLIVTFVVYAVNAHAPWPVSHFSKELFERIEEAFDSASAVIGIIDGIRVGAAVYGS